VRHVYKGEQSFHEFTQLEAQGTLLEAPIPDGERAQKKLTVLASKLLEELGRDVKFADFKDELKRRAVVFRCEYTPTSILDAIDDALRERRG
jgi:hypothetical protein